MERNKLQYTPEMLAGLEREDLRGILVAELKKDSTDIDEVLVRQLIRELETRGKDPSFSDDGKVEAACVKFCKDLEKDHKQNKRWYHSWMLKVASVMLVLGILFFSLPGAAQADNVRDVLTWWSDSVFRFFAPGEQLSTQSYVYETDHPGLQKIYDLVSELGVDTPVVPRWISMDLELLELKHHQMAEDHSVYACFDGSENKVLFTLIIHNDEATFQYEKNEELMDIWELAGNEHHVFSNENERVITWMTNRIECTVVTDCPEEEVYRMIKSIYTSEG